MGLIQNQSIFSACGGVRAFGGIGGTEPRATNTSALRNPSGSNQNRFSYFNQKVATPPGYLHPMALVMPKSAGGLGTSSFSGNLGTLAAVLAAGKYVSTNTVGTVTVSADLVLFINTIFTAADLAALGTFTTTQLGYLVGLASNILASSSVQANNTAIVALSADITPFTELSPQSLANAVWSAPSVENNLVSSMGEKLNAAGLSANPWSANLSDNNSPGTFGNFVQKLLTLGKFLGLK